MHTDIMLKHVFKLKVDTILPLINTYFNSHLSYFKNVNKNLLDMMHLYLTSILL